MVTVISAGIAPGLALLSYFYLKDKYDTEPISSVIRSFIFGALLVFPIMFIQYVIEVEGVFNSNFSQAFISSSLLEEFIKWFVLIYTVYQHVDFDEHYDGIVYGAAVSLGFASVENIMYLFSYGVQFAVGRALLPVSSHALFGVIMGYYLGKSKLVHSRKRDLLLMALLFPFLLHGIYDYILLTKETWLTYIIPFMIFLWWLALRKVKIANGNKNKFNNIV
ncbi:intramembrane metalloprotease PrsW [Bacillus timonensis]|nr:intramembrane metalloprotease PrsW [Bacillus timonensis]